MQQTKKIMLPIFEFSDALCLVKLAEGQQQCNIPCTGEYNPVCGQQNDFFRIFSNRCRLERENFCGANPRKYKLYEL